MAMELERNQLVTVKPVTTVPTCLSLSRSPFLQRKPFVPGWRRSTDNRKSSHWRGTARQRILCKSGGKSSCTWINVMRVKTMLN